MMRDTSYWIYLRVLDDHYCMVRPSESESNPCSFYGRMNRTIRDKCLHRLLTDASRVFNLDPRSVHANGQSQALNYLVKQTKMVVSCQNGEDTDTSSDDSSILTKIACPMTMKQSISFKILDLIYLISRSWVPPYSEMSCMRENTASNPPIHLLYRSICPIRLRYMSHWSERSIGMPKII